MNRHPHDTAFKESLSCIIVARNFFEVYLSKDLLNVMDLSTLAVYSEHFVADSARQYSCDIVYQVTIRNGKILYLLIEQESKVKYITPFRIYNYLNLIIQKHLKQHNQDINNLPLVYTIIYYTGRQKYFNKEQFFSKFTDIELAERLFNIPYQLIELNRFTDQEIIEKHKIINLLEYVQKNIYIKDFFVHNSNLEYLFTTTEILEYKQAIIRYLCRAANISDNKQQGFYEQLRSYYKNLSGENIMGTLAQHFINQGITQGITQGISKGKQQSIKYIICKMLKAKLDLKKIIEFTGIGSEELQKIIKEFKESSLID